MKIADLPEPQRIFASAVVHVLRGLHRRNGWDDPTNCSLWQVGRHGGGVKVVKVEFPTAETLSIVGVSVAVEVFLRCLAEFPDIAAGLLAAGLDRDLLGWVCTAESYTLPRSDAGRAPTADGERARLEGALAAAGVDSLGDLPGSAEVLTAEGVMRTPEGTDWYVVAWITRGVDGRPDSDVGVAQSWDTLVHVNAAYEAREALTKLLSITHAQAVPAAFRGKGKP